MKTNEKYIKEELEALAFNIATAEMLLTADKAIKLINLLKICKDKLLDNNASKKLKDTIIERIPILYLQIYTIKKEEVLNENIKIKKTVLANERVLQIHNLWFRREEIIIQ